MIGLDTNLLVRYLTKDDPAQFAKAKALIDASAAAGDRFVISNAVLCELVWVLRTTYEYSREDIARALEQILATAEFDVERSDEARLALREFQSTKADFSDALIGRINQLLGADHTVTFDRDLKGLDTFRVL
jgi:predicted nucleic-acid-binding protein